MKKKIQKLLEELKVLMGKDNDHEIGIILHVYSDYSGEVMVTDIDSSCDEEQLFDFDNESQLILKLKKKIEELTASEDYFPEKWEDLGEIQGFFIDEYSEITSHACGVMREDNKNLTTSTARAKHILAYCQLSQIAQRCNENATREHRGWLIHKPWRSKELRIIEMDKDDYTGPAIIEFNSKEDAEKSLKHHKDLWNDYYGITDEAED